MTRTIFIKPSNKGFAGLASQEISTASAISELCDNSIASIEEGSINIDICVKGDWTDAGNGSLAKNNSKFLIKDDGSGIKDIEKFITPWASANRKSNSLNRHGVGSKVSIAALGAKEVIDKDGNVDYVGGFTIITKQKNEQAIIFNKFTYGNIEINDLPQTKSNDLFPTGSGTLIEIDEPNIHRRPQNLEKVIYQLGARYQNFLGENGFRNKKLKIRFKLINNDGSIKLEREIPSITPQYTGNGQPIIYNKSLNNEKNEWTAKFDFGISITQEELDREKYNNVVKTSHGTGYPYHVELPKIDIFKNGVLVVSKNIEWAFGETSAQRYFRNGAPRIKIHLGNGFDTTLHKDNIISNSECKANSVEELKEALKKNPDIRKYIHQNFKEKDAQSKLSRIFKSAFKDFVEQPLIGPYGEKADFSFIKKDIKTLVELKINEAMMKDANQLVGYLLKEPKFKIGMLIANGFSTQVKNFVDDINNQRTPLIYNFKIEMHDLKEWI